MESKSECYCTEYTLVSSDLKLLPCLMLVTQTPSQSTASMTQGDSQKWPSKANSYGHTKKNKKLTVPVPRCQNEWNDTNAREYSNLGRGEGVTWAKCCTKLCQLKNILLSHKKNIVMHLRIWLTVSPTSIAVTRKKNTEKVELTTNTDDMVHQFRKGG